MQIKFPVPDIETDINGNTLDFKGSRLIKKPHSKLNLTKAHIEEYLKCQNDILYFAENYYYITEPDLGLVKISLYEYQKVLLINLVENRFNIVLAARQIGKSTTAGIFLLWYMIFHHDKVVGILANKEKTAIEIFGRVRTAYEYLPNYLKPGATDYSKTTIGFDNGSKCIAASTSSTAVRGYALNTILLDELSFIPHNIFQPFYNSVYPTISKSKESKIIAVSTSNGLNHFYKFWEDAKKAHCPACNYQKYIEKKDLERINKCPKCHTRLYGINEFVPFEVKWDSIPGRDANFKKKTIAQIGIFAWMQEFENNFLGSMNTLVSTEIIKNMVFENPVDIKLDGNLNIYKKPESGHKYIIGVDTSKGVGAEYSVSQVIDVTKYPFEQVAIYRCNTIAPMLYYDVVFNIANMYNKAWLIIENNSEGKEIIDGVWYTLSYTNVYNDDEKDVGFRSTKRTKSIALSTFKELLEAKKLIIHDLETINEISTFIKHKNNTYSAEKGKCDDTVTSLLFISYFVRTEQFKIIFKEHDVKNELYQKQMDKLREEFELPVAKYDGEKLEFSDKKTDIPDILKKELKKYGVCLYK